VCGEQGVLNEQVPLIGLDDSLVISARHDLHALPVCQRVEQTSPSNDNISTLR
jgi:hypothetical protein